MVHYFYRACQRGSKPYEPNNPPSFATNDWELFVHDIEQNTLQEQLFYHAWYRTKQRAYSKAITCDHISSVNYKETKSDISMMTLYFANVFD